MTEIEITEADLVEMSFKDVMALELEESVKFAKVTTIGDYLKALLSELWIREEAFSGKRPFGNSGWKYDIYQTLLKNRLVTGVYYDAQEDESWIEIHEVDQEHADRIISECIWSLN